MFYNRSVNLLRKSFYIGTHCVRSKVPIIPITCQYGRLFSSKSIALMQYSSRGNWRSFQFHATFIMFYTMFHAFSNPYVKLEKDMHPKINIDAVLIEADDLFNQNKYLEVCELLDELKGTDNVDILWRLSRALYNVYKESSGSMERQDRDDLLRVAFTISKHALQLNDTTNFAVHKWYAILLDANAALDGTSARIKESINVKNHMIKAVELNPRDATTLYMLGSWCYSMADLSWVQRKVASALFGTPPTSSYEEALEFFIKAEEVEPNFYSMNLLMLGKTYLRLNDFEKAALYLRRTATYLSTTDEGHQASKEASDLLKTLPNVNSAKQS